MTIVKRGQILIIEENARLNALSLAVMCPPTLFLMLSSFYPIFKNTFNFISVLYALCYVLLTFVVRSDYRNGVKWTKVDKPAIKPVHVLMLLFFPAMILTTATLNTGYYIIPSCWVISWACHRVIITVIKNNTIQAAKE